MAVLPYLITGDLVQQDGTVIQADVPLSIWPATGITSQYGEVYDHEGEASAEYTSSLVSGPANRRLIIDGVTYTIMQATLHPFLPHVELQLRRVKPGGP